jgi:hypothetical protein
MKKFISPHTTCVNAESLNGSFVKSKEGAIQRKAAEEFCDQEVPHLE